MPAEVTLSLREPVAVVFPEDGIVSVKMPGARYAFVVDKPTKAQMGDQRLEIRPFDDLLVRGSDLTLFGKPTTRIVIAAKFRGEKLPSDALIEPPTATTTAIAPSPAPEPPTSGRKVR